MSRPSTKPKRSTAKTSKARPRSTASRASKRSAERGSAPPLFEEWIEFLRALVSAKVKFVLVGGHAVAVHGEPRLTEDLDVLVEPTAANGDRIVAALETFGFGSLAPDASAFVEPRRVFMLGRKPRRIDLLTSIDGVEFAEALDGHIDVLLGGVVVPVIGKAALIANKLAAGRAKDLADVEALRAMGTTTSRRGRTRK